MKGIRFDENYVALLLLEAICKDNNLPSEPLPPILNEKENYIKGQVNEQN